MKINRRTYIVITSRGSTVDAAGLPGLLESQAGVHRRDRVEAPLATTVKALKEKGVLGEQIARVHSPMGLELNAETPEEIAVSIMAEVLMIKDKGTGKPMKGKRTEAATEIG